MAISPAAISTSEISRLISVTTSDAWETFSFISLLYINSLGEVTFSHNLGKFDGLEDWFGNASSEEEGTESSKREGKCGDDNNHIDGFA